MKNCLVTLAILVFVAAVPLAFATDDKADLIALDKKWGEAQVKGDAKVLEEIYADNVVLLGANGIAGKKQAVDGAKQNAGRTASPSYTTSEYEVTFVDANTAIMTHRAMTKGVRDGESFENDHRSLHVFVKRNGRWMVAANAGVPVSEN